MRSKFEEFLSDKRRARLFEQESLVFDVTEMICSLMEEREVTKTELAEMLSTSKANVSQLLDGSRNMTLKTLADLAFAMGHRVRFRLDNLDYGMTSCRHCGGEVLADYAHEWNWEQKSSTEKLKPRLVYQRTDSATDRLEKPTEGSPSIDGAAGVAA